MTFNFCFLHIKNITILKILLIACFVMLNSCSYHSEPNNRIASSQGASSLRLAFYNVENLFDTIDDPHTRDNDFLPISKLKWNSERYTTKLLRLGEIIQAIDQQSTLACMGLAEVENKQVLADLLKAHSSFKSIHFNSSDTRGIDVCLLYNERLFKPLTSYLCKFKKDEDPKLFMREVLLVKGVLAKDTIYLLVNHWPSRREGKEKTDNKRIAAAMLTQEIIDSIYTSRPSAKLILMGDFNDEPTDESMSVMLQIQSAKNKISSELINPFLKLKQEGRGTCRYKREWLLFDQILISNAFINKKGSQSIQPIIFNPDWLFYKKDINSGPFRTYMGNTYYGGYSDHFPVYIEFKK